MIEVTSTGPLTTIQDQGRRGYAHLGVPRSGALDARALARANELVGNPPGAAGLEITLVATELTARVDVVLAVTGAIADIRVGDRPCAPGRPLIARAGAPIRIAAPIYGARVYVAFAGGIAATPVLGSRSTDTLSGLGPPRVRPGDVLPLGALDRVSRSGEARSEDRPYEAWCGPGEIGVVPAGIGRRDIVVGFTWGPRDDMFTEEGRRALGSEYRMGVDGNRVGVRLRGPHIGRLGHAELASEGIVLGAIQVTSDGQPLVFLADHPTTGGYPVIGVVDAAGVARLAQARPGDTVIFRPDGSWHGSQRGSR